MFESYTCTKYKLEALIFKNKWDGGEIHDKEFLYNLKQGNGNGKPTAMHYYI